MSPDGSNQEIRVTFNPWNEFAPAWSLKGTMIAFTGIQGANMSQIYVMNPNGSSQKKLSSDPAASDTNPAWSPDESKIAFHRDSAQSGLYVMNADGTNATRIGEGDYPAWSPDGTKDRFYLFRRRQSGYLPEQCGWQQSDRSLRPLDKSHS